MPPAQSVLLPVDILWKIAFLIGDVEDLIDFLEALGPCDLLGPLAHLYELFTTHHHSELWPRLRLNRSILDSSERHLYEKIVKYYGHIVVDDVWEDMAWLQRYLNPMAQIAWNLQDIDIPLTSIRLDDWAEFKIFHLAVDLRDDHDAIWCTVALSELPSLTCLEANISCYDLDAFFANVAASKQITQLHLSFDEYQLTAFDLVHLTEWLRHQPVCQFGCELGDWEDLDFDVKEGFYHAMFNCPTLHVLELSSCELDDIDFTEFDFPMKSLVLHQCSLASEQVQALVSRLETSKITRLQLTDFTFDHMEGIESLLEIQPKTPMTHLALSGLHMDEAAWSKLAPLIEKCTLETLVFYATQFSSNVTQSLATAIQNNQTLCELDLNYTEMAISDVELLIQSMNHPSRHKKEIRIKGRSHYERIYDPEALQALKALIALAVNGGGEFVYEED
ncbi:hypothetical protein AeRB84_016621 [Aphanomyces euteiches]|nr:hypothetical protein AeRB84_016621 [Aphanomyces euteiches]